MKSQKRQQLLSLLGQRKDAVVASLATLQPIILKYFWNQRMYLAQLLGISVVSFLVVLCLAPHLTTITQVFIGAAGSFILEILKGEKRRLDHIQLGIRLAFVLLGMRLASMTLTAFPSSQAGIPTPTPTLTNTPIDTPPPTGVPTPTYTPTTTSTPALVSTQVPTSVPTPPPTGTPTSTYTSTLANTPTHAPTQVPTSPSTPTPTGTPTSTYTPPPTNTPTLEPTQVPTSPSTPTPTGTSTSTYTPTLTNTPTLEPTQVPTSATTPTAVSRATISQLLANLQSTLNRYIDNGDVGNGRSNGLNNLLQNTQQSLTLGQIDAAEGQLQAFVRSVEEQRGNQITTSAADDLITQAEAIILQLQALELNG